MDLTILGITVAYLVVTSGISLFLSRRRTTTTDDFMVADRKLGWFAIFCLIYTGGLGIGSTVGIAESGFKYGISMAWFEIAGDVSLMLVAVFFVKYFREYARHSLFETLERAYDKRTRITGALITAVAYFTIMIAQITGTAGVLHLILDIPLTYSMVVAAAIVVLLSVTGGQWALAYSNMVHTSVSLVGTLVLLAVSVMSIGGLSGLSVLPPQFLDWWGMGTNKTVSVILSSGMKFLASVGMVQAMLSAKTRRDAAIGVILGGLGMLVVGTASTAIGVVGRVLYPTAASLTIESYVAFNYNPVIGGFIMAGVLASLLGTLSGGFLSLGTFISKDLYKGWLRPKADDKRVLNVCQIVSTVFVVGTLLVALAQTQIEIPGLIWLHTVGLNILSVVTFVIVFGLYRKTRPIVGITSLIIGTVCTLTWVFLGQPFDIDKVYITFSSTLVSLFVLTLALPVKEDDAVDVVKEPTTASVENP